MGKKHSEALCLITFSNNPDHQNVIYSMFNALYPDTEVYTLGIKDPKSSIAPHTANNFYFDCPLRPGITKGTFRFSVIRKMAKIIRKKKIKYLYFESQHIWNMFLMMACRSQVRIIAVHDVIPHDGNKAMAVCNYVTCHQADHVILRNRKFRNELSGKYHLSANKITSFAPWRDYKCEKPSNHSGTFLYFGRIRRYKGFDLLEQIISKTPEIKYQIVGEPDEESKPLVERIKKLPNACVNDTEVSDEKMEEYFTAADWVILPYFSATQSGIITDAYRMSRPVITFDVGAIKEQVEDKKTGFLVPAGDVDSFAQTIKTASKMTTEQTAKFAHEAYLFGYEKYSAKAVADNFVKTIYNCKK